jgi:large subunit ribosomal protein L15
MSGELSKLEAPEGANKAPRIKGRGTSSGLGKQSGRGGKGQKARKSGHVRPGFEGGQMPMQRRLPKRGFTNIFAKRMAEVRVVQLDRFEAGTLVDFALLKKAGLAKGAFDGVKIIGKGTLSKKLQVKVHRISKGARDVIEGAGGTVELIPDRPKWKRGDSREARRAGKQKPKQ